MRKQTKRTDPDWLNCTCPICGKKYHLKKCALDKIKTKSCCSKECSRELKRQVMVGEGNHQYGLKGAKNASWKYDRRLNHYGYWQVRQIDHPFREKDDYVMEHRLVAEQYLLTEQNSVEVDGKRYLSPEYVVHHIDFDRQNNSPDNLMVMTKAEHQKLHVQLNSISKDANTGRFVPGNDVLKARRITPTAILPKRITEGAAGYDLYVDNDEPISIMPHNCRVLWTNVAVQIPKGYCGCIYARSGNAIKRGLRPATGVSVIDSDYRGNLGIPLFNDSDEPQIIEPHERVAQMVIQKPAYFEIEVVDSLDPTERSDNGFGSTGR